MLDASVPGANGECGPLSDTTFGQVRAGNTRYADDALTGFNKQLSDWQGLVSVQQQLRAGMALNVTGPVENPVEQLEPQSIPAGVDLTLPVPIPALLTVSMAPPR